MLLAVMEEMRMVCGSLGLSVAQGSREKGRRRDLVGYSEENRLWHALLAA